MFEELKNELRNFEAHQPEVPKEISVAAENLIAALKEYRATKTPIDKMQELETRESEKP